MRFKSTYMYVFVLTASGLKWSTNTLKASGPFRDNRRLLRASAVAVPSEENEPELQPVVSLPQRGSVGQEEKSDETVGGSETNVAQDKTGNDDTSVGGLVPRDQERIADHLRVHMTNICRTLGQNN